MTPRPERSSDSPRALSVPDEPRRIAHRATVAVALMAISTLVAGCGGPSLAREEHWRRLAEAMRTPVRTRDDSAAASRTVQAAVDDGALDDLSRAEVEARIGRGDPCSRHPRCAELGFEDDDWFYTVGDTSEAGAQPPLLIVGFDVSGRVRRVWNLRTH
ncbi:MAG: hypothetical protein NZ898_10795 [Myxococcota bacterium]|nr:hypothetical protein [Myxococcota bacterium]MDW8363438.1 hypothetical protein [Myxococcales bacterium]